MTLVLLLVLLFHSLMPPCFLLISISIFISTSLVHLSTAADTLTQGQVINEEETALVSLGGIFELRFFSAGNSTARFLGILYHNITIQTVVWVANRATPVLDSTGSVSIGNDGNLIVTDSTHGVLWSTNSSLWSNNSTARLLDNGNLVLYASNGTVAWQSFDHPGNTFIPGMKLSLNTRTGENQLFTSWKSPRDPTIGNYSLGLDPGGSAQIFIWEGTTLHWRSGQWDGQTFIGTKMRSLYLYGFKLMNDVSSGIMSFTFEPFNATLLRFVMQYDGVENTSMLVGDPLQWVPVWVQPQNQCEFYGQCGNNGWCSTNASPMCSCLRGFEPRSEREWRSGNWSGGCVRRNQLQCGVGNGNGFSYLEGVKLPDRSEWATTIGDPAGCQEFCGNNCSCLAYAYVSTIGCLTWNQDLMDIYQFSEGGHQLFFKLNPADLGGQSKKWIAIVSSVVGAATLIVTCTLLWWKFSKRLKDCWNLQRLQESSPSVRSSKEAVKDSVSPHDHGEEVHDAEGFELALFSFSTITSATSDFSEENKLGQGGFGLVYKGKLPEGEEIAIKRLSTTSGQGIKEFKNEVTLIAKLQHRNLVKLLGCCIEREEKILIYEYMANKSLDTFLFDSSKQSLLDWSKRFTIIEGIARGLLYLHQDSRLRIVHRDLKASNVLLDENLNPKISDFGMARIFGGDQNQDNTNRVVGTYGYMSPEYAMEGLFSIKSDVYSFGILVLEIVTGRKNNTFFHLENSPNIVGHAWPMWNEGRALELVDPSIRESFSSRQALRCIHVALMCVQDRPNDRPDMATVLLLLARENTSIGMPKRPTFTTERGPLESGTMSNNDLTITVVSGR